MGIEKWIAVTSVGLFLMFVGEMISVYLFMTDVPEDFFFGADFDPNPKILQFISISVAPAGVLAGLSFLMSKRYGSKTVGYLIIAGGVVLLIGMVYVYTLVDKVEEEFVTDLVSFVPLLFVILSIPVMIFGASLLKTKKKRPKKEYF